MNIALYRDANPYCELSRYFQRGRNVVIPLRPSVELPLFGLPGLLASDIHHIVGKDKRGRTNDERNVLHICRYVHLWIHGNSRAGQVLCCAELRRQGRLDWDFLSNLDRKCWPGKFETDKYIEQCRAWPFVEALRVELVRKAA